MIGLHAKKQHKMMCIDISKIQYIVIYRKWLQWKGMEEQNEN